MDMPWTDRSGRLSALRAAGFALVIAPALWLAFDAAAGGLGPRPLTEAIHRSGDWAVRLLAISLLVTPLRRITGWGRWIILRRMLGLAAFFYAAGHLGFYVADQGWNLGKVMTEIVSRIYLLIGFVTLVGLGALAATSTDRAIRAMGRAWRRLHRLAYPLAALAVLHFFLQSKADASEAAIVMGVWLLAMGWRLADAAGGSLRAPGVLVGVAVAAAIATAGLEAGWYASATGAPWQAVLEANLHPASWMRPAWWVLAAGLAAAAIPPGQALAARLRGRRAGLPAPRPAPRPGR